MYIVNLLQNSVVIAIACQNVGQRLPAHLCLACTCSAHKSTDLADICIADSGATSTLVLVYSSMEKGSFHVQPSTCIVCL